MVKDLFEVRVALESSFTAKLHMRSLSGDLHWFVFVEIINSAPAWTLCLPHPVGMPHLRLIPKRRFAHDHFDHTLNGDSVQN